MGKVKKKVNLGVFIMDLGLKGGTLIMLKPFTNMSLGTFLKN
jgi:hypothetical protein